MIVLDLVCKDGHAFEGWFASAESFAEQQARALVSCPHCGSTEITRKLSAPHVHTARPTPPASPSPATPQQAQAATAAPPAPADLRDYLKALLRQAARNTEDVGTRFATEARRIHYGETPARDIRGQASRDEVESLLDEGISVLPVPPDDEPVQ